MIIVLFLLLYWCKLEDGGIALQERVLMKKYSYCQIKLGSSYPFFTVDCLYSHNK